MAIITQYSRIAHHTITATGSTFSIPVNEDFTSGSWTINDLALSEIGVNEGDKKAYIRIGDEIKEITGGAGASSLSEVMNIGNTVSGSMYSPNGSNSSGTRLLLADNKYTLRHSNSSTVYSRIDGSYLNAEIKTVNDDNGTYGLLYAIPNQAGMVANDDNNFIQSSITAVADNVDNRVELKSQYIKLNAVDVGTVSVWRDNTRVYDLPMVDGTNGQVISTDGSGNLSFTNSIVVIPNIQEIYVDSNVGDDITGDGSVIKPYETIQHALTFTTDPTKVYTLMLACATYTGSASVIPGNVNIRGNGASIQFDLTLGSVGLSGSQITPFYVACGFQEFTFDLSPFSIALPIFDNCGITKLIRTDTSVGAYIVRFSDGSCTDFSIKGNVAFDNTLFVGSGTIETGGTGFFKNSIIGISIDLDASAQAVLLNNVFAAPGGTLNALDPSAVVLGDSTSLSGFGGSIVGTSNITYLDNANTIKYDPTTSGDWAILPSTVQQALDYLVVGSYPSLSEVMDIGNTVSGSMFSPDGVSNYLTLSDGGIDLWSDAVNGLINIQVTDPNGNISINGGSLISIVDNLSNTIGLDVDGIYIKASAGLSVQLGNDASSVIIGEDSGFNTGSYTVFSTSRVFENRKEETLNNTPIQIGEISMENDTVVNIEVIYNAISATGSLYMGGTIKEVWKRIGGTASKVGAGLSVIDTEFSTAAINVVETGAKDGIELEIVGENRDIVWDINWNYIRTKLDMPA